MFGVIEQLRASVANHRDEMAELTAKLVAIDTENPPGRGYQEYLRAIGEELETLGFPARIEPVPGGDVDSSHPRFWLRSGLGEGERAVYFHGHVDVVPADDPSQFEPRVTDDTIFGRGSTDMKGGLVSMFYAMKVFQRRVSFSTAKLRFGSFPTKRRAGRSARERWLSSGSWSKTTRSRCSPPSPPAEPCGTRAAGPSPVASP